MMEEMILIGTSALKELIREAINEKQSKEVFAAKYAHLPELLSVKDCSEYLGRSEKTITRMARTGELRAYVSKTGFKTISKQSIIDLLWKVENQG